jgi:mannose-6-phosphate isomerase-like protein (cupin superfamily)
MNAYKSLNFAEKIARIDSHWTPRVIAEMNDYQFKVVKLLGDFIWHDHLDTDETFIVLEGHVLVNAGEMYVVSKGVEHKPFAEHEVKLLLIEPKGVLNTGNEGGERTAQNDVWV